MDSGIDFHADYKEALLMISRNKEYAGDIERIKNFLPIRKNNKGREPSMNNKYFRGPRKFDELKDHEQQWVFGIIPENKETRRFIIAVVLKIAVQTNFGLFVYEFNGRLFRQVRGGPIGARVTMAAAQLVTEMLMDKLRGIFRASRESGIKLLSLTHCKTE